MCREKLGEEEREKVDGLLEKYPSLRGFYWAKKIRELYRQDDPKEAAKLMDNIIFNLKSGEENSKGGAMLSGAHDNPY